MAQSKNIKNQTGFTMIEVIAVLIIIGILSAVAVSRISSTQSYSAIAEVDILKMHLRYAQLRALGDDKKWGISFNTDSYSIVRVGDATNYNLPNENSPKHTLPSGITVSGSNVTFDEWGRPVDETGSPVASNIAITISSGGSFNVTKNTGFIP